LSLVIGSACIGWDMNCDAVVCGLLPLIIRLCRNIGYVFVLV